jgi:mRNA-degrading endonuclease YafQ of YafQ-DinJ toxin-antitoxin module
VKALSAQNKFNRDLKRIGKRGYDRDLLDTVIDQLRRDTSVPEARRDHSLMVNGKVGENAISRRIGC